MYFSPVRLALEVAGAGAVVAGTLLVPGQHVHQQVGVAQTGLPLLWFGVTYWKQKLWWKQRRSLLAFHFRWCNYTQSSYLKWFSPTQQEQKAGLKDVFSLFFKTLRSIPQIQALKFRNSLEIPRRSWANVKSFWKKLLQVPQKTSWNICHLSSRHAGN